MQNNSFFMRSLCLVRVCVGFINPGSLADRLPRKGSAQADSAQLMGRPKSLNNRPKGRSSHRPEGLAEEEQRPLVDSGPPLRPERSLRSPVPPDGLSDRKAWQSTTSDSNLRLRPRMRQTPTHCSSPTGTIRADWD